MIVVENFPLFRTRTPVAITGVATDPAQPTERQPLPADMWRTGFATFAEARRYQKGIDGYQTRCGRGDDGFYVAAPGSGLCAVNRKSVRLADDYDLGRGGSGTW